MTSPNFCTLFAERNPTERQIRQFSDRRIQLNGFRQTNHATGRASVIIIANSPEWQKLPSAIISIMTHKPDPFFAFNDIQGGDAREVLRILKRPIVDITHTHANLAAAG